MNSPPRREAGILMRHAYSASMRRSGPSTPVDTITMCRETILMHPASR